MTTTTIRHPFNRLLLTGAAGGLGKVLRERLKPFARHIRLSDIANMAPAIDESEEVVLCDLSDKQAVHRLVEGVDAILHFGGVSVERPFEEILGANISGVFHIYEAARKHGVKRVIFASSNHVIGFYKQDEPLDALSPRRPDGYYGLSKSYGEDMASFYFDRYGIETVSIRIGSSFPEPQNRRMLSTWLSYDDLTQLIECSLYTRAYAIPWCMACPPTVMSGGTTATPHTWVINPRTALKSSGPRSRRNPCRPPTIRPGSIRAAPSWRPARSMTDSSVFPWDTNATRESPCKPN